MVELSRIKKLVLQMSDKELVELLKYKYKDNREHGGTRWDGKRWFDQDLCGLNQEGMKKLKQLEQENAGILSSHVDKKQLRYLKELSKMKLVVPDFFREKIDPRTLYHHLSDFCLEHDIPREIVSRVVPLLISYIETGHMRPVIFVGEKGCGKTTAVRMLVEEALQLPVEIIKVPQMDGGQGLTGYCGVYTSADAGCLAKARIRTHSILNAFLIDEIDKATANANHASVDCELLSVTDDSNDSVYDNYLETTLVGLQYCPMFMTANDLQNINPVLADRCTIIHFPNADAHRIKSITHKYVNRKLQSSLYNLISFDYALMDKSVDCLLSHNISSLRRHQQMAEAALEYALDEAFQKHEDEGTPIPMTEDMFYNAVQAVLGSAKRSVGF